MKKQRGFADETVLVSDAEPNRIIGLSFWDSKEDAERYDREQYPQIHETMKHLLENEPVIRTFDVESSTTHRILARKAAQEHRLTSQKASSGAVFSLSRLFSASGHSRHCASSLRKIHGDIRL